MGKGIGGATFQTAVHYGCAVEVGSGFADLDVVDRGHAACFIGTVRRRLENFLRTATSRVRFRPAKVSER